MCRVSGSGVLTPQYTKPKTETKKPVQQQDCKDQPVQNKKNDSVKVETKNSKNVIKPVELDCEKQTTGEKISKGVSGVIGNTQDALDVTKKIVSVSENSAGFLAKSSKVVAPVIKTVSGLAVVKSIEKVATSPIANKAFGVFAVAGGGFEIARGVKELKKGKTEQGVYNILNGGASVVCGGALFVGALPVAAVAGGVGLGLTVVKYGNDSVKKLGWLKGKDGKAQSAFERLAEKSNDAQKYVEKKTGSKVLGYTAKIGAGVAMVPAAVATSVVGAVYAGGKAIGGGVQKAWNWGASFFK